MPWLTPSHKVPDATKAEISTSWALFILIMLLISALFGSYLLQTRKVQAVHETVMSIFAGTLVAFRQTMDTLRREISGRICSERIRTRAGNVNHTAGTMRGAGIWSSRRIFQLQYGTSMATDFLRNVRWSDTTARSLERYP